MNRINMCGYEDILKSDVICTPIDINGNLMVEVDIPVWMRERLFNIFSFPHILILFITILHNLLILL